MAIDGVLELTTGASLVGSSAVRQHLLLHLQCAGRQSLKTLKESGVHEFELSFEQTCIKFGCHPQSCENVLCGRD